MSQPGPLPDHTVPLPAAGEPDPASGLPIGRMVDTAPAPAPQRISLTGRFVDLVPLTADHADGLFPETHGPDEAARWAYLGDGPYSDAAAFRAGIAAKAASADPLFFAILDHGTGAPLGYQSLMRIDVTNRVIEIGHICYGRQLQQRPAGTEAQFLLASYAMDRLGYRRLEWKCNALNAPSRAAALRFGYRFEGLFRQHLIMKGRSRDTAWYSILDDEWPAVRAAFEAWLDPSNFDADGRQRSSLAALRMTLGPQTA